MRDGGQLNGHGWVVPRPDGAKARCGGPKLCRACQEEVMDAAIERLTTYRETLRWKNTAEDPPPDEPCMYLAHCLHGETRIVSLYALLNDAEITHWMKLPAPPI